MQHDHSPDSPISSEYIPVHHVPAFMAAVFGVPRPHIATVYRWIRQGRLRVAGHVGRKSVVLVADLRRFVLSSGGPGCGI